MTCNVINIINNTCPVDIGDVALTSRRCVFVGATWMGSSSRAAREDPNKTMRKSPV